MKKSRKIIEKIIESRQVNWNKKNNTCMLLTQFTDGSLLCEPITPEKASELLAKIKY